MGVQVSDDLDGSDTRFFRIGVPEISGPRSHGANHPPVLDYIPDQEVDERDILSFTATATDQDNDYLTYTWSDVPSGAVIIGRSFSWYAPPAAAGFHAPEVTVSDGHGGTDDQLVNIEVKEVPPVFSADGYLYSGCSPIILNISHTATDPNGIDSLIRYHIEGSPAGTTTINERTGAVTWSIPADTVQDHFDIVATDYDGRTADLLILFREDDSSDCDKPPILSYINDRRVRAGHTLAFDVTATDPDGLDSALTYSLEDAPSGASITSSNGVGRFSWTPSLSQVGSHEITFVVTDEDDLSADQSVTIRVTQPPPPPNDRPVINRIADQQVNETDTLAFNITATDPDGPEDSIRFGLSSPPAGATITTLAANSTHAIGAFSWTPSEAQGPANHTITITAVDNKGASSSEPFLVTVREVNVPPTLEPIGDRDLDELTLLTFVAVANDTDIPHTLTYSLDGPPEGARIDPANGTFSWIPTEQQGPGNYTITVTVDDGLGGAASRSFNVTVREVNLQPVLAPISNYTTIELTPVAFTATARDPDGQDIAYGLVDPPAGAAIDPSTGRFVWEPARGQAGNHQITVAASDGFGGMASQSFAVQVDQAPPGIRFAPVSSAADGRGGFEELDGAFGVDTIDISGRAYAVVASQDDSGIQIIDLTDPSTPRPVSYLSDDAAMALGSATSVAAAQISGRAYAVVASWIDDGVQIVDITDPSFPVPVSSILDGPSTRLEGARGVAIHQVPGHAYAVVTALDDDSVQIVNITDPANPDPTAFIRDAPATVLEQPWGVAVHQISGRAYAITAAWFGDGIQIIDLADPANPDPTASVRSGSATLLSEAKDVAAFDMNGRTYAAVASEHSNAIQLVDVTDPSSPDPTGHILDDQSTLLDGASGVDVFKVAGRAYAVAVSINEGGIQLIEVTDPRNPRAIAAIPDDEHTLLSATTDVAVFRVGNAIYAAVTSHGEDGIQIVRLGSGGNAAPSIDPVPPQTVDELTLLEFDVTASDPRPSPRHARLLAGGPAGQRHHQRDDRRLLLDPRRGPGRHPSGDRRRLGRGRRLRHRHRGGHRQRGQRTPRTAPYPGHRLGRACRPDYPSKRHRPRPPPQHTDLQPDRPPPGGRRHRPVQRHPRLDTH